jgi:hypothetical protein
MLRQLPRSLQHLCNHLCWEGSFVGTSTTHLETLETDCQLSGDRPAENAKEALFSQLGALIGKGTARGIVLV